MNKQLFNSGKFFALGCICMSVTSAAFAAEEALTELPAVTISASRSQSKVEEMPLYTTVISQEDIQKSPAQTLDQLLRNVPGLNFTGVPAAITDPTGHSTKMRGLGTAKVLVLLDGVPVMDPFYLTTQWFKVPLSNIERVEVVRGGNSSLWGNMAVAGVINIVSKRVRDNAGEITASAGSFGARNVAVSKNFMVSDALSFSLTADRFQTSGYQTTPEEYLWRFPNKQPADAKDTNFQLTTYFKPSADLKGFMRLGYHVQDQNLGYVFNNNLQKSPDMAAGVDKALDESSGISANVWAQYVNFEKYNGASCYWQASGTACPSSSSVTAAQINNNVVQYYTQYGSQRYRENGGSVAYSRNMEGMWNSFQMGVDYRNLSAKDAESFYAAPTVITTPQKFNSSTYGEGNQTFEGLFGQARVSPLDALELTLSGRYDSWTNNDRINTRTTAAGATTGGAYPESTKTAFNPSLAARYELNSQASLRGAAYKSFRAPGFNNMTRTYGSSTPTIANPDLSPESLTGWEVGADFNNGPLSMEATYFLYDIKNMIATYRVSSAATAPALVQTICWDGTGAAGSNLNYCGGSANFYTNDQDGQSHGLELTGKWKVQDNLTLNAAYTHTETYLTRHGSIVTDPVGVQLAAVPKNAGSLGAAWKPSDKLRAYAELRYIGPMLIDTASAGGPYGQGGNTVYNASASYAWDKTMDLFASVVNLFDRQYSENNYTYNQPFNRTLSMPRAINAGLKVRF
jgi:iron complex outermembrane receptor protein